MQAKENLTTLCGLSREETKLDFSGQDLGAGDAVLIANDISDMGALSVLNLANNDIGKCSRGKLKDKPTWWKESDHGVHGSRDGDYEECKPEGAIAIANAIKDMGAISSVNLLWNHIGTNQAKVLANILKEHPALKSLCGNTGDETVLDMSGKEMDAAGATMLAAEIIYNGALSVLNLANNDIGKCRGKLKDKPTWWKESDHGAHGSRDEDYEDDNKPEGIIALANAIKVVGALTSLNLSSNDLEVEGAEAVAEAIKVTYCAIAIVLVQFHAYPTCDSTAAVYRYPQDNGAMTSLNLSANLLGAEGAKHIAEGIKVSRAECVVAVVLAPFSCPSAHRIMGL
jgi:hypothetical protein